MIINNRRALAYTTRILDIKPIPGADNIELCSVLGWKVIAKKNEFKVGDLCVYFEIDSKLPEDPWFEFMRAKNFKVKTMKLNKFGGVISQGLALPINVFSGKHIPNLELQDVTEILGVTYSEPEDNDRKAEVYPNKRIFKNKFIKKLMKYSFFRNILYKLFANEFDSKYVFPIFVSKTDEERIENQIWRVNDGVSYIATEKLDGTSCTFAMKRVNKYKFQFYVASRNRCLPEDNSIYWELARKFEIEKKLHKYLINNPENKWVYIQGEGLGPKIQGNPLKLPANDLFIFNFVTSSSGRVNPYEGKQLMNSIGLKWVPILEVVKLPDTMEKIKEMASGKSALNENVLREGIVYRSFDGSDSFKNVCRQYLLKH